MLILLAKGAMMLLLFLLLFVSLRNAGQALIRQRTARLRLSHLREERWSNRLANLLERYEPIYRHVSDVLEASRLMHSLSAFFTVTLALLLAGIAGGVLLFGTLKGVVMMTAILATTPYLALRLRLISFQLRARLDFLPAAEVFYQYYVLSASKNMRSVLHETVMGNRLLYPLKPVFDQLHRNLAAGRETDDSLRIFAMSLGHVWADYFANILKVALQEGVDVTMNLKELIADMRRAQINDQKERNRLLEIRLASFSPIFFLLLFLGINFKANYANAYRFYILDPEGRGMLLNAAFLIFASFLLGVYLSMRRM